MHLFKNLAWRIYLAFLIAAVVPTGVAGVIGVNMALDALRAETASALEREVSIRAQGIARFLRQVTAEVQLLAESRPLLGYGHALAGDEQDAARDARGPIERDFAALARLHPHVYQVRFLDQRGMEQIRVDRQGDAVTITPQRELQDKSDRYYFHETMARGVGSVYVSPLDLNIERGVVEEPQRPVIRIAAPVGLPGKHPYGLVIINLHADAVLGPIQEMADARGGDAYLFDAAGHYVSRAANPEGARPSYFPMRPVGDLEMVLGTAALQQVLDGSSGVASNAGWSIARAALPDIGNGDRQWTLALAFPEYRLFDSLFSLYALSTVLAVGVAVTALGGYVLSRRLLRPLGELKAEADSVAAGDFTRRVSISGDDEIAVLGERFNAMAASLQGFYAEIEGQRGRLEAEVKQRTRDLEQERVFLFALVQHLGDGVLVVTEAGVVKLANARARRLIGLSHDVVGGRIASQWAVWPRLVTRLDGGGPPELLEVDSSLISVTGGRLEGGLRLVVLRDVTEERRLIDDRRDLDQQMFQMERMVTFGELAMGLAHEIGNPLAGMKAVVQALQYEENLPPGVREALRRFESEVDRLAGFLRSFHGFTAQPAPEFVPSALADVVEDVLFWTRKEARKIGVVIETRGLEAAPALRADPQLLKQVLVNLFVNALHAMPDGGRLSIRAEAHGAGMCRVSIADTGPGIVQDLLPKIFNPFFTTRADGTGLGLAIVRKIVLAHGARIHITSELGRGVCVTLDWPVAEEV